MVKIFLDTANLEEIQELVPTGLVNGVTTNPTLLSKTNRPFHETIKEICAMTPGPVSAEVTTNRYEDMLEESLVLANLAANVVIKLPVTPDGLRVCEKLTIKDIPTNMTLCFSAAQAILAAKVGATFVSPFVGRLDDVGADGVGLIDDILEIYGNYPELSTQVLASSLRHPQHVVEALKRGVDAITISPQMFLQLYYHPLTEAGLKKFLEDAAKIKKM